MDELNNFSEQLQDFIRVGIGLCGLDQDQCTVSVISLVAGNCYRATKDIPLEGLLPAVSERVTKILGDMATDPGQLKSASESIYQFVVALRAQDVMMSAQPAAPQGTCSSKCEEGSSNPQPCGSEACCNPQS